MPAWEQNLKDLADVEARIGLTVADAERKFEEADGDLHLPSENRPIVKKQYLDRLAEAMRPLRESEAALLEAQRGILEREASAPDGVPSTSDPHLRESYRGRWQKAGADDILRALQNAPVSDRAADDAAMDLLVAASHDQSAVPWAPKSVPEARMLQMLADAGGKPGAVPMEFQGFKVMAEVMRRRDSRRSQRALEAERQLHGPPPRPVCHDDRIARLAARTGDLWTRLQFTDNPGDETSAAKKRGFVL